MRKTLKKDHASGTGLDRSDLHGGVLNLAAQFQEVKFAYVPRRKNQEAHQLARKAVNECTPLRRNMIMNGLTTRSSGPSPLRGSVR
jgi:hypothetical protein